MDHPKAPSHDMEDAVSDGGTVQALCELCGRIHFGCASPSYWNEGELEALLEKKKADPQKYIEDQGADTIYFGTIDGKQVVLGCPCNGLSRYEAFIWQNRHVILDYLERRTKARVEKATSEAAEVARVKERLP